MKRLMLLTIITIFIFTSCTQENRNESSTMNYSSSTDNQLAEYLQKDKAEQLLDETWSNFKPLINDPNLEQNDFDILSDRMTDEYIDLLFVLLSNNDSNSNFFKKNISLPLISDDEVEIVECRIRELVESIYSKELIITEKGSYPDLELEFTRNNHFIITESGEIKLYRVTGDMGLRDEEYLDPDNIEEPYLLFQYLYEDKATELLLSSWSDIVNSSRDESSDMKIESISSNNTIIEPVLLDYIFKLITKHNSELPNKKVDNLFIPFINDIEVNIKNIELNYVGNAQMDYQLIITESGEFRELNFGFERKSHYYVNSDGEIKLFQFTGSLGYGKFSLPYDVETN